MENGCYYTEVILIRYYNGNTKSKLQNLSEFFNFS